jgi:hypothetical protein
MRGQARTSPAIARRSQAPIGLNRLSTWRGAQLLRVKIAGNRIGTRRISTNPEEPLRVTGWRAPCDGRKHDPKHPSRKRARHSSHHRRKGQPASTLPRSGREEWLPIAQLRIPRANQVWTIGKQDSIGRSDGDHGLSSAYDASPRARR